MDDCEVMILPSNVRARTVANRPRLDPEAAIEKVERDIKGITQEIQILQGRKQELIAKRDKLKDAVQQQRSAKLAERDWNRQDFSWSKEIETIQNNVFKIPSLRAHQLPTMNATMSGIDSILIMPTGGGKSLCYQLPALASKGVTLVVSPLVSLMEDQVMGLKARGIQAKMLHAAATREEVNEVHSDMINAKSLLKLLYVTPEKLAKSKRFMAKLQKMHQMGRFARLAIDEVHCCSQWGHDFRPDYKFLGIMHKMFPGTPILGLTATATSRVIQDVQKILNIQGCLVLKASFNRPNLIYEVRPKPSSQDECIKQLQHLLQGEFQGQSGIIYTMTIKDAEELVTKLKAQGVRVAPYHAQLEAQLRSKVHRKWLENEYQAVVATIAFGMGIDKPNVRFVIHHCISKSMENFYQESGRAGRDGKPAKCIIFWRFADLTRQSTMVFTEQTGLENLYGLISYCIDSYRCRRHIIAEHFDERWEAADCRGMCDHCRTPREKKSLDTTNYGEQLLMILTKAISMDERLTGQKLIDLFMGKGPTKLRVKEATANGLSRDKAENIIAFFLVDGFLKEDFHFTPYSTISYMVQGPKAEAGISPSPLIIGGQRKLSSLPNSKESSQSDGATQITETNKVATVDKAIIGKITKRGGSRSNTVTSGGSHSKSSSDYDTIKSKNMSDTSDATQIRCDKYTDQEQNQTTSSKGVIRQSSHAPTDDGEDSYSDTDMPHSTKRRRIIKIDDSSDASDD